MRFSYQNWMFLLITLLILLQPTVASALPKAEMTDTAHICLKATQMMESKYHIKPHLLTTIASIESGRWNEKTQQKTAWPWTINAQGKGYFFETKAEAVKKVKELQKQGVVSIDVGCMQINLLYHGSEFSSLESAFDPYRNVEYAAKFLKNLYETNNDWIKAAMAYHSSVPEKADAYKQKIVKAYEAVKSAHNTMGLTGHGNFKPLKKKDSSKAVAHNLSQRQAKKTSVKTPLDVKAWREAKLEEYRMQKILARQY